MSYRPLAGLRVVDMADEKAELCGRLLADLGADVIRVEPPGGATSRRLPPFLGDVSLYFEVRNANKRGATIDLGSPEGRRRLLALLEEADVWIETTRPGTLAALGLDPEGVTSRMPQLVTVSVTDFGQTGPYRDFQATDAVMEGMSWMLFRAGVPELPPVMPPGPFAYDIVGVSAAFAVLTACLDRCTTGAGQYLDMSVMEAIAQTTDWGLTSYSVIRKFGMYGEVRDGGGKVYPILPCADGDVRLALVTGAEWRKVRAWIRESGSPPEIVEEEYWEDQRTRMELFDDLMRPVIVELFKDRTMMDLSIEGQKRGIPITPMLTPADALVAEQFETLGSFTDGEVFGERTGRVASGFLVVDGERVGYRSPAPRPPRAGDGPVGWLAAAQPASGARPALAGRPYAGLRVVEFGMAGAVPEMARLLAEYGADVIRVESPKRIDIFRQLGGPAGVGGAFASSNRSTRSLGVDFTGAAGAQVVRDLVQGADIILENLPPGTLERFGLGPEDLRAVNPAALVVSSQSMGRRGPWAHWRGYGSNTQLPSGMSWLWSFPDVASPVPQNVAFPDHLVGRLGAFLVAADLLGRHNSTTTAGHVEIVQAEMALNLLSDLFLKESVEPGSVCPLGNRSSRGAP
ncbi:MAG: CoA transferase, partial [Acidimicrobiaceae bacterium]|nr:CoA transferase [Acidimicrobiaceae bacterium]